MHILIKTTFVLRLFKILSAPSRASASNIEKMAKNSKIYSFSSILLKVLVQIGHIIACSTRLVIALKEIITMIDL
jgi:hypothetical protein